MQPPLRWTRMSPFPRPTGSVPALYGVSACWMVPVSFLVLSWWAAVLVAASIGRSCPMMLLGGFVRVFALPVLFWSLALRRLRSRFPRTRGTDNVGWSVVCSLRGLGCVGLSPRTLRTGISPLGMRGLRLVSIWIRILGTPRNSFAVVLILLFEPLVVCRCLVLGCWLRQCGGALLGVWPSGMVGPYGLVAAWWCGNACSSPC